MIGGDTAHALRASSGALPGVVECLHVECKDSQRNHVDKSFSSCSNSLHFACPYGIDINAREPVADYAQTRVPPIRTDNHLLDGDTVP